MVLSPLQKELKRRSLLNSRLFLLAAASAFATLFSIFGPTLHLVEEHHSISKDLRINIDGPPLIEVVDVDHEEIFLSSFKSCLPWENSACKTYIPEPTVPGRARVQRVAVLAPPGDLTSSLLRRVEQVKYLHNKLKNKEDPDLEIISTTHVPPYGYGKNHGLTKIIRLIPQPMTLEVTDALQNLLEPGETNEIITLADLKAGLRQVLRFHCRLSHVAAHTALMSIPFFDLVNDPAQVSEKLRQFLSPRDVAAGKKEGDEDDQQFTPDDDQAGLFGAEESYGTQILTHIQETNSKFQVERVLDQVLLDEFARSKNQTIWPCLSFWSAGEEDQPQQLSELNQRLAQALSPDCGDASVKCFVPRDLCETQGDALCLPKPKHDGIF